MKLSNPFTDLVVTAYPPDTALKDDLSRQTLALARYEGMDAALKRLSVYGRKKVRAMLKPYHHSWWKPGAIWAQLPALLHDLAHPETDDQAA